MSTPSQPKTNVLPTNQVEEQEEPEKQKEPELKDKTNKSPPPYKPPVPFPQRLKQTKLDNQYQRFVKVIEKLHVEIPFTETITQVPSYAKFLKDILTNKRRLDDPKPSNEILFQKINLPRKKRIQKFFHSLYLRKSYY